MQNGKNHDIIGIMDTKIVRMDEENIDREIMRQVGGVLRAGGLTAFPTDIL